MLIIDRVRLEQTCYACPEQYDAFDPNGNMLGYLRLRHGNFTVECPDVGGKLVYSTQPQGEGAFYEEEREFYLKEAVNAIKKFHGMPVQAKYVVAIASIEAGKIAQWVVDSDSELNAAVFMVQVSGYDTSVEEFSTFEEFKKLCLNWDLLVSVVKL